jgi:hypothetical protein
VLVLVLDELEAITVIRVVAIAEGLALGSIPGKNISRWDPGPD